MGKFKTKLYTSSVDFLCDRAVFEVFYNDISPERKAKIDRLSSEKEKRLSLAAYLLLSRALSELGIDSFELGYGEHGKPYLIGQDVFFNLSHSNERVLCAVSRGEVGCDVEFMREFDLGTAKRFFSNEEYAYLIDLEKEKQKDAFFRIWTLKESFIKATGRGFSLPLRNFSVPLNEGASELYFESKKYYFKEYGLGDGYKCAACSTLPEFEEEAVFI